PGFAGGGGGDAAALRPRADGRPRLARHLLPCPERRRAGRGNGCAEAGGMASDDGFDAEAVLAGAAAMLDLTVTAEQRPGVLMHLANTRRVAGLVADFPLPA